MGSIWNDIAFLEKAAKFVPYIFIVLGFLIAFFGQYVRSTIESRVKDLKTQIELSRKHTPPLIEAFLAFNRTIGQIVVAVKAQNDIPFKARWVVVTKNNKIISGLMMQDAEFYPSESKQSWSHRVDIPENDVVDNFVELRFTWQSVYFAELGQPNYLQGKLIHSYRLVDGKPAQINE
jgi:hypothetical protein